AHDVSNLFVTDGSCMVSSATANPSLTYMALSARAANYAAGLLVSGEIGRLARGRSRVAGGLFPLRADLHHRLFEARHGRPEPRFFLAQRKPHPRGPGGGFRHDRNPSAFHTAAI